MRYLITLTPLEPFLFGGENTFGKLLSDNEKKTDPDSGTYLVKSRMFPQQSAILGMIKKEIMTQATLLTRKIRGEWVDTRHKKRAYELVGSQKFDIFSREIQNFGAIKSLSHIFLMKDDKKYIKKVDIDSYVYKDSLLQNYKPKNDIYDNFVQIDSDKKLSSDDIFQTVQQIGNKKNGGDNSLFKKSTYILKDNFTFAFYLESDFELKSSRVVWGAARRKFNMKVKKQDSTLSYKDKKGYLTLLSDAYITLDDIQKYCDFAITSEISFQTLQNKKHATKHNAFAKSKKIYLYEKGSVFINPTDELIANINNKNCQQIGLNIYTKGDK